MKKIIGGTKWGAYENRCLDTFTKLEKELKVINIGMFCTVTYEVNASKEIRFALCWPQKNIKIEFNLGDISQARTTALNLAKAKNYHNTVIE